MSAPPCAIAVPWGKVLNVLGVQTPGGGLPAQVRCPICSGQLTVYDDTQIDVAYHQCIGCGSQGDLISLAAKVWGVPASLAFDKLVRLGIDVPHDARTITSYSTTLAAREAVATIWEDAKAAMVGVGSGDLPAIREALRLTNPLTPARWTAGPGQLLGGFALNDLRLRCMAKDKYDFGFRGYGWNSVVMTAYEAVPGRVCGFLCAGRDGTVANRVYVRPIRTHGELHSTFDPGLAGRPSIAGPTVNLGPYVLGVADPFFAARLQIRHAAADSRPLPILSFYYGDQYCTDGASWRTITDRTPVIWGWTLTAQMLHQAILSDGYLAYPARAEHQIETRLDHYLRDNPAVDIVRRAFKRAKPWPKAFGDWAAEQPDDVVEAVLADLARLDSSLSEKVAVTQRIRRLVFPPTRPRAVRFGSYQVIEQHGHTYASYYKKSGFEGGSNSKPLQLVMDALVRVDKTRPAAPSSETGAVYVGRIIYKGQSIPFEMNVSNAERFPRNTYVSAVARAVPGALLYIKTGWARRIIRIAMAMNPPEMG